MNSKYRYYSLAEIFKIPGLTRLRRSNLQLGSAAVLLSDIHLSFKRRNLQPQACNGQSTDKDIQRRKDSLGDPLTKQIFVMILGKMWLQANAVSRRTALSVDSKAHESLGHRRGQSSRYSLSRRLAELYLHGGEERNPCLWRKMNPLLIPSDALIPNRVLSSPLPCKLPY